jgi:hypothetical protein
MIASRLLANGLLFCLGLSACRQDAATSVRSTSIRPTAVRPTSVLSEGGRPLDSHVPPTQFVRLTPKPISPSAEERALIDRIVALHPGEAQPRLRAVLADRYSALRLPPGSGEQDLLIKLSAARAAAPAPAAEPVEATVVLVDRLTDPSASAIVLRRKNALPHDLILLPDGQATTTALSDGINALFRMRRAMGDIPDRDTRIVIRGQRTAREWKSELQRRRAEVDLAHLTVGERRLVAGVGEVRAIDIPLQATAAPAVNASPRAP